MTRENIPSAVVVPSEEQLFEDMRMVFGAELHHVLTALSRNENERVAPEDAKTLRSLAATMKDCQAVSHAALEQEEKSLPGLSTETIENEIRKSLANN